MGHARPTIRATRSRESAEVDASMGSAGSTTRGRRGGAPLAGCQPSVAGDVALVVWCALRKMSPEGVAPNHGDARPHLVHTRR